MADHVGRRRRRRERSPARVLDNPPPKLIPEDLHTSPFKGGNTNSGEKLRKAPLGVPMKERIIYKLKEKFKSKNEIATLKNGQVIDLINECLNKRCESFKLQELPRTRKTGTDILQINVEAKKLAADARAKSKEVEDLGELAVKVPGFLLTDPVL